MLGSIFSKSIWDNRRAWIGWSVSIAAVASMYASFFPSMANNPDMAKAMESYPEAIKKAMNLQDITQPENYLGSSVFGLLVPALTAVMAISYGVKALAADEEAGTMDLVLAHPVGRIKLALQRFAAVAVAVTVVATVTFGAMLLLRGPAELSSVGVDKFFATCLQLALFGLVFAALSFAVGAYTGRRGLAVGVGAAAAVLGYVANSFLPQIEGMEWTKNISPFHWYLGGEPLRNGIQWPDTLLMLAVAAILVAIGTARFHRRDIAV